MNSATQFFDGETQQFAANYEKKAGFKDRLKLFAEAVQKTTPLPAKVLDFGCGPGVIALELARLGYDVLGMDGSAEMVRMSQGRVAKHGLKNIRFAHNDAADLTLPVNEFDAVVCSSVVEYVKEDIALIKKLVASLKPKGHLILSVPHAGSLTGKAEDVVRSVRDGNRGRHLSYSLRRYRKAEFYSTLRGMGLQSIACTNFEFPLFGSLGVQISRLSMFGTMALIQGQKIEGSR
jgi:2-polyprenyl-3-methyl-5-hydroxy-6-metoxy-1,4-benzoquinol methylase